MFLWISRRICRRSELQVESEALAEKEFVTMEYNRFEYSPKISSFRVISTDMREGEKLSLPQVSGVFGAGGEDISPQLSWSGFPQSTKSFVITIYDIDAPTASGVCHWAVVDIPAHVTELVRGVGDREDSSELPAGAFALRNDGGTTRFIGAAPPIGAGKHRYVTTVYAVDISSLGISKDASLELLDTTLLSHTLGWAAIVSWYERT